MLLINLISCNTYKTMVRALKMNSYIPITSRFVSNQPLFRDR